jgi:hypothetical protein
MFLTFLIAAHLHFNNGCHWIAPLLPQYSYCANSMQLQPATPTVVTQLHLQATQGIPLQPAHLTIVKTWSY